MKPELRLVRRVLRSHAKKPHAYVVAGHNGSGKSTMWKEWLAPDIRVPLVNADRLMMSILPDTVGGRLPSWARELRDEDERWMRLSQRSVQSFIVADVTMMFDNSQDGAGFRKALLRTPTQLLYDVRDDRSVDNVSRSLASAWLDVVAPRA